MDLSKNAINGVGALVVGAILVGGGLLVAKPQYDTATDYRNQISEAKSDRSAQAMKLSSLKEQAGNLPQLKTELADLQVQIPSEEAVGDIAEVAVNQLPDGVTLQSFQYQPMLPLTAPPPPTVSLSDPAAPFEELTTAAPPPPPAGDSTTPAPDAAPATIALQQIPVIIQVKARDSKVLAAYLDALAQGSRLILVNSVQAAQDGETGGLTVTIYGYAFANAVSTAPAAAPAPTTPAS